LKQDHQPLCYKVKPLHPAAAAAAAAVSSTQALSRAMSGSYVNFGVFELYGDAALKDALSVALRMALSIPLPDIMSYK
jgi:hypothetical protein